MPGFADHFSRQAVEYARYRPRYPSDLFHWLASLTPGHRLAWDVGTGNGQAAQELVRHYHHVVATDASAEQLAHAAPHERIEFRVERAEDVSLVPGSVDLVTVAIAVHWFDLESFYAAVRRVGAANGILAVWTYHLPEIEPEVDRLIAHYYATVLAGHWAGQVTHVESRYQTLPFPFDELVAPEFAMESEWDLAQLIGFLESWSATRKYREERGEDPVSAIWQELVDAWGDVTRRRRLHWALHVRVGRLGAG
jgi:SAM-dependent methyltransferase